MEIIMMDLKLIFSPMLPEHARALAAPKTI